MKKILSVVIALAMLLSVCVVCVIPTVAAAAEGTVAENDEFIISTRREDQFLDDPEDALSRPGGIYTDDGFEVNPLGEGNEDYYVTWPNNTPYVTVQTLQNLSEGFYMEVRIDEFVHWNNEIKETAEKPADFYTDTWYAFHIWDSVGAQPGQVGENSEGNDFGHGIESLIRTYWNPKFATMTDAEILSDLAYVEWYDDTEELADGRNGLGSSSDGLTERTDDQGRLYLTLEIVYDADNDLYTPIVNGVRPPVDAQGRDTISENLTSLIYGDCENADIPKPMNAYIGFSVQTFKGNAPCSFTITKMGTSKETAIAPCGDDKNITGVQRDNGYADVVTRDPEADVSEPAFVITGDSDTYKFFKDNSGSADIVATADGTLKITSHTGGANPIVRLENDVSYDLRDYPVQTLIFKNFCTCEWTDLNNDGEYEKHCDGSEIVKGHYLAGTNTNGSFPCADAYKIEALTVVDGEDTYTVFLIDYTDNIPTYGSVDEIQRIHGTFNSFDGKINKTIAGRDTFELVATAYLHNEDGAAAWAEKFMTEELGLEIESSSGSTDSDASETEPVASETEPVASETEPVASETEPVASETEPVASETESKETAPQETESKTEKPSTPSATEKETDKKPSGGNSSGGNSSSGGCGSVAGFGAIALVAVAAVGLISFKKKED